MFWKITIRNFSCCSQRRCGVPFLMQVWLGDLVHIFLGDHHVSSVLPREASSGGALGLGHGTWRGGHCLEWPSLPAPHILSLLFSLPWDSQLMHRSFLLSRNICCATHLFYWEIGRLLFVFYYPSTALRAMNIKDLWAADIHIHSCLQM